MDQTAPLAFLVQVTTLQVIELSGRVGPQKHGVQETRQFLCINVLLCKSKEVAGKNFPLVSMQGRGEKPGGEEIWEICTHFFMHLLGTLF